MTEYQTAIIRLVGKVREDEELLTDEFNERCRGGWELAELVPLSEVRIVAVFRREG